MNRSLCARWLPALAGALIALAGPSHAEMGPRATRPLAAPTQTARLIVQFKSDLPLARRAILSAAAGQAPAGQATAAEVAQALQLRAGTLGQRIGVALRAGHAVDGRTQVVLADGIDAATVLHKLRADPDVAAAFVDGRRRRAAVPNDPLYGPASPPANGPAVGQWYLKPPAAARLATGNEVLASIDAQSAWDITKGSTGVVVAVLDTGVRYDHPDLAGKLLPGYDMVADAEISNDGNGRDADASDPGDWVSSTDVQSSTFDGCDESDSSWHGTLVSGLIGAATNNGSGMAGSGWNVKVLPVRVLGKCFGYDSDILVAMQWAAGIHVDGVPDNPHPAKVINMSLGGTDANVVACSGTSYPSVVSAVLAKGVAIVAAAGNESGHGVQPPGNCPGVIAVAGVRHIGTKVGYSNVGPDVTVAAPAGNCVNESGACLYPVLSTTNAGARGPTSATYSDSYNFSVGTSFSAPLVSGTVALMLSADPSLTPAQVKTILANTSRVFPFRGAPASADGAVKQCHAPDSTDQIECYCTTSTCGAGMLDASWAVYSAAEHAPQAAIAAGATPVAAQPLTLSSSGSAATSGRAIVAQQWTLIDGGGIVSQLGASGTTASGPTVTVTPAAAGKFSVRLLVTDDAGVQGVQEQTFVVPATAPPPTNNDDGGGGGAVSAAWLAALALAVAGQAAAGRRRQAAR